MSKPYYVYVLRCVDDSLYTGITTDVKRRFAEHLSDGLKGAKYTKTHTPKEIAAVWQVENRSVASITYQNLFLLFPKMSGMSGTISDAADELRDVYGVDVIVIPSNRPVARKDLTDYYYKDTEITYLYRR